jgi:hypothetical protein
MLPQGAESPGEGVYLQAAAGPNDILGWLKSRRSSSRNSHRANVDWKKCRCAMPDVDWEPDEEIDKNEGRMSDEEIEKETDEIAAKSVQELYVEEDPVKRKALIEGVVGEIREYADARASWRA